MTMSSPPNFEPPKIPPDFLSRVARVSSISPCRKAFPSRKENVGTFPAPKAVEDAEVSNVVGKARKGCRGGAEVSGVVERV